MPYKHILKSIHKYTQFHTKSRFGHPNLDLGRPNLDLGRPNLDLGAHIQIWGAQIWRATAATAAAEEFVARARPGIPTRPGMKYRVRQSPHFD